MCREQPPYDTTCSLPRGRESERGEPDDRTDTAETSPRSPLAAHRIDGFACCIQRFADLPIPKSEHAKSGVLQIRVSGTVGRAMLRLGMVTAIELDDALRAA